MFYDIDDNPLNSYSGNIYGNTNKVYPLRIDCKTGKVLIATEVSGLMISARHESVLTFQNIEGEGLDLSGWDGERENFFVKVEAQIVTIKTTKSFSLEVRANG